MAAVKGGVLLVKVHGSALSLRASGAAAHQLRKDLEGAAAAGDIDAMVAVGCNDSVSASDGSFHANGDGLLAVI